MKAGKDFLPFYQLSLLSSFLWGSEVFLFDTVPLDNVCYSSSLLKINISNERGKVTTDTIETSMQKLTHKKLLEKYVNQLDKLGRKAKFLDT